MTALCLRSIRKHYPDISQIYVLYDDMAPAWPGYEQDCQTLYTGAILKPYTDLSGLDQCDVGWWRAQLVKLHVDLMLPEDEWLVVDGDVIFDEHVELRDISPYSPWVAQRDNILDSMVTHYVDHMLGQPRCRLSVPEYSTIITSIIPFRWLDREQLTSLRDHVCRATGRGDMLAYHCELFRNQGIVGYVPEGDRMVMHEWELIEAWNHLHRPGRYRLEMTGAGYQMDLDTTGFQHPRFRHNSLRDRDLGRPWFERQDIQVADDVWAKIMHA